MRLQALGVALASLILGARGSAQGLDRTKRPVIEPDSSFVFPRIDTTRLPNILRLVVVENHSLPLVAVRLVVGVDSTDDPAGKEGLYVLTAGMLHEATTTRTADQLASQIAAVGATPTTLTPSRFTTTPQNLSASLELMADMVVHPTFPDSALARLKTTLVARKQLELQAPATVASRVFLSRLFGSDHPVARTGRASEATMASISREDLVRFHAQYYRPNNATLIVVGDVRAPDVKTLAAKAFSAWRPGGDDLAPRWPDSAGLPTKVYLVDRPAAQQSYVFIGALGPRWNSPDVPALEVMAQILGASGGSRVYDNLRERHGYMYAGTTAAVAWPQRFFQSIVGGSAAIATAKTDSAVIQWTGEIRRIAQAPPSPGEMTRARAALVGSLPAQIETDDLIANRLMSMLQTGLPLDFYNSYSRRIEAVTPDDVRSVAAKYLDSSQLVIVVAGDRKTVEPLLRAANIAPIVVVDDSSK